MNSINITLPVQAWNNILEVLGDRPFKEVAELISEIKRQAEAQIAPSPAPTEPEQAE
jgi:hypothetical protein